LGYSDNETAAAPEQFLRDYQRHTGQVNRIFEEIFSATEPQKRWVSTASGSEQSSQ
jgi:hypothetical protein